MQGVLLNLGLLLNLAISSSQANVSNSNLLLAEANPIGIVVKVEGSDIMSGPENSGTWRRLHLPPGFVVEQWGKQDDKIFVWSMELEWGGWAAAADFEIMPSQDIKPLSRYSGPYSAGQGEKVNIDSSLSVATIEAILREAQSPAILTESDFAAYIYKRSFFYHIDPAYLLAFFRKESSYGTAGAPVQTKNIGNIRCTEGYQCSGPWRKYDTWKAAADDWYNLIATHYIGEGLDTVSRILWVYAPPADGNYTPQFIRQINGWVAEYRDREAHK